MSRINGRTVTGADGVRSPQRFYELCTYFLQISNRVLYVLFTHVQELFGTVVLKQVTRPLRWSNMATMPTLPETQAGIKEEIRRQVCTWPLPCSDPTLSLSVLACFCADHMNSSFLSSVVPVCLPPSLGAEFSAALGMEHRPDGSPPLLPLNLALSWEHALHGMFSADPSHTT